MEMSSPRSCEGAGAKFSSSSTDEAVAAVVALRIFRDIIFSGFTVDLLEVKLCKCSVRVAKVRPQISTQDRTAPDPPNLNPGQDSTGRRHDGTDTTDHNRNRSQPKPTLTAEPHGGRHSRDACIWLFRAVSEVLLSHSSGSSEFCFLRGVALRAPPRNCNRGLLAAQTLGVSHTGHHSNRRDAA